MIDTKDEVFRYFLKGHTIYECMVEFSMTRMEVTDRIFAMPAWNKAWYGILSNYHE